MYHSPGKQTNEGKRTIAVGQCGRFTACRLPLSQRRTLPSMDFVCLVTSSLTTSNTHKSAFPISISIQTSSKERSKLNQTTQGNVTNRSDHLMIFISQVVFCRLACATLTRKFRFHYLLDTKQQSKIYPSLIFMSFYSIMQKPNIS